MVKSTLESMNSRICFDLQFTQSYTLSLVVLGHLKGHLNGGGGGEVLVHVTGFVTLVVWMTSLRIKRRSCEQADVH